MEEDNEKLYDALIKLNKKVTELDQRNMEVQTMLSALSQPRKEDDNPVIDQEATILDPYSMEGYKSLSLPNGGFVKLRSKPLCVNGRHIVESADKIIFCSKCNAIICTEHRYDIDETVCTSCLEESIKEFDEMGLYILFALVNKIPLRRLRKRLNISQDEMEKSITKLQESKYIFRDLLFRYQVNIHGESAVNTARLVRDFSFLEPLIKA